MRSKHLLPIFWGMLFSLPVFCQPGRQAIATRHGHRFINHTQGTGPKAQSGGMVTVNVYTWLADTLVQSTVRDMGGPREVLLPDTSELTDRAPAVFDAFFLMTKGDSATLFQAVDSTIARAIREALGDEYGMAKEIRYEIVLIEQLSEAEVRLKGETEQHQADSIRALLPELTKTLQTRLTKYKAGKLKKKVQKTASGLEYIIHEKGSGPRVQPGETVLTNYLGIFQKNGEVFDSSYDHGGPQSFTVGLMIPGFDEGLLLLNRGAKATFFIPWKLAYGEQGADPVIPAKADLVFYVEIQ